ncbi:MAG: preprotein translocase subunit SecE [bacterium]|nr:preprotein translocase subunit SecE [bacterium]MDZ4231200.1 preprotein translocase subunit SecE [Patescibacteria group bacterium]
MFSKLSVFLKESLREFKRINWPTRKEALVLVGVVVLVSLAFAVYLGALDFLFVYLLELLVI